MLKCTSTFRTANSVLPGPDQFLPVSLFDVESHIIDDAQAVKCLLCVGGDADAGVGCGDLVQTWAVAYCLDVVTQHLGETLLVSTHVSTHVLLVKTSVLLV